MNSNESPDAIDIEALDLGPKVRYARTATFAPNWKTVLLADASVGVVILILGVLALRWTAWVAWPLMVAGVIYLFLVVRRALQWRWLRNKAGLR